MKKFLMLCAAIPLTALSSCSISINGVNADMSFDFKEQYLETVEISPEKASEIEIDINVGQCSIKYGNSEGVEIVGSYTCTGISEKKVSEALENVRLYHKMNDDTLYITLSESKISSNFVNVVTDLDITLPKSFKDFTVCSDVGDIELDGLSGSFDISVDVGRINCKDITLTGDSEIKADVGDIDISVSEVAECRLEAVADVGNIDLDTQGLDYTETDKSDDIVSKEKEIIINDKCKADLKADVGNIKISK